MNPDDQKPDQDEAERQLDQLLKSAVWPDVGESLSGLETHWDKLLEQETVKRPLTGNSSRHISWLLAIAASLLVGGSVWMALSEPGKGVPSATPKDPVGEEGALLVENNPGNPETAVDGPRSTEPVPAGPRAGEISQGEFIAALASVRNRQTANPKHPGLLEGWTRALSSRIGQNPGLAALTQTLVHELDRQVQSLYVTGAVSLRQRQAYEISRRRWEKWAWKYAESGNSPHQTGSRRFAIAVSTNYSMRRLEQHLQLDGLSNDAAIAIAWMGSTLHIDRALRLLGTDKRPSANRARRQLLTGLLQRPHRQAALQFLRYLREPSTRQMAIEIASATDRLPSDVWLESIASHDRWRFDSAIAVAQVCDKRITHGLIYLASNPTTSQTAMMALLKSPCAEARNFVNHVETSQQFATALIMARKKLREIEVRLPHRERRNNIHRLLP